MTRRIEILAEAAKETAEVARWYEREGSMRDPQAVPLRPSLCPFAMARSSDRVCASFQAFGLLATSPPHLTFEFRRRPDRAVSPA